MVKTAKKPRSLVPSRNKMCLTTLAGVLAEEARVYRLQLNNVITPERASKQIFMLDRIRSGIEALPPEPQISSRGAVEVRVISIESGRYISHGAIERLASGEDVFNIAPDDLLAPVVIEHAPATAKVVPLHQSDSAESVQEAAPATETFDEASIEDLIESFTELVEKDNVPDDPPEIAAEVENGGVSERSPNTAA
jgi:hypothetical protein